ncbi:MAG: isopeptide-forming domain-containing fimbrial protein, partial [Clostridia bacterium]|nr:isopeptide-forming domain-containing fimbrial protein [Clostridia bacterium]
MKTFKKLFTVLAIVLVTILALMPKAFAADLTVTVTGEVAGRTLSVYKLFDLTVEGEGETAVYRYTWDGLASEVFFTSKGYDTVAKATDYLKGFEKDATALTNLAEEYYAFCNNEANATALAGKTSKIGESVTVAADAKNVVFTVPGEGYYLVYDETTADEDTAVAAAMLQNVTKNAEVKLKVESIVVDKTVDETTANVGDDVNFTVSTTVPNVVGYDEFFFELTDTLSKGLTFNNDVVVTID